MNPKAAVLLLILTGVVSTALFAGAIVGFLMIPEPNDNQDAALSVALIAGAMGLYGTYSGVASFVNEVIKYQKKAP